MTSNSDSLFTRFILEKKHYRADLTVRYAAFMPNRNGETSVFKINNISEAIIWRIGNSEVAVVREKALQARADINKKNITEAGLNTEFKQSFHYLHANIIGWPDDRLEKQEKARQLADNAQLHLAPNIRIISEEQ
jgi:hypothetical protein